MSYPDFEHRCSEVECQFLGQRTFASCNCYVSPLDMARAEVERLATINGELLAALRPFANIGLPTNSDYRPEIRLPREQIIAARTAVDAALPAREVQS